jgi:hypothetical protein
VQKAGKKHMTKRLLLWVVTIALFAISAMPVWAKPAPKPAPNVPAKAGQITALLPVAKILRGSGKTAAINDAKKGDELIWNDLVKTEKGGRARITLADQSILSLGSQAELRIVKHDPRAQQTTLQMAYGRVRAQVASITRDGGSFELRTPTAVAGVIGTDFGVDASPTGGDTFVCIAGATQISNADPNVPGSVQCSAGQTTTVQPGKSPTAPVPASLQQLQQLIQDTEPAIISSISPAAALPGTNFDSTIAGTKMGKVASVTLAGGSGVTATIKAASDTAVQIHVVVDPTAPAGPRTITLVKETGAASATVFMVLGTPIGDPKKAYLEALEQLKSTGVGGLGAFLTGAQQAADQVAQQITQANQNLPKPLDLSPFADSLNQQYSVLSNDLKGGTGKVDKAAQDAATAFATLYDDAYQALLQRDPTGAPDTTFRTALTGAFTQANTILQSALQNTQTGLTGSVQQYGNQLSTIQQTWSQNINSAFLDQQGGPLPKINALERIVELGATATFEAASTSSSNSSVSINSYQWTLCSPNYQPNGFGQLLPQGIAACNGIAGYVSSGSEFQIPTCSLNPGNYYARLAVIDSNNRSSQMDVRLTVLSPNYATPGGTVRAVADAYTSLQLSQFLRYFDAAQFSGYTPLSENIRQTMQSLASMSINLRLSQENVTCNDATVRADWQQNYTFIADPSVYNQTEQLSVRLQRAPGTGWFITDFQGDNGKVQGVPGPQTADAAAPDLEVTSTTIDGRPVSVGVPLQVGGGSHSVAVTVSNNGTAPLQAGVLLPLIMTVQDKNGTNVTTIDSFNGTVPSPLSNGNTTMVTATLNLPTSATNLTLLVQVNPTCNPPEKNCGAANNVTYPLIPGLPDFVANFVPTVTLNGIVGRAFNVQAVNVTPSPYPAALTVVYAGLPAGLVAASPANNTTNINGGLIAGTPAAAGSSTITASATAAGTTKNVTGALNMSVGNEISITPSKIPTLTPGAAAQPLSVTIAGGVYPVTVSFAAPAGIFSSNGTKNASVYSLVLTAPGAATFNLSADATAAVGNNLPLHITATDAGIPQTNTPPGNVSLDVSYTVGALTNYVLTGFSITGHTSPYTGANALQLGEAAVIQATVANLGNTNQAGSITVSFDCGGLRGCATNATAAAPAVGAPVTVSLPLNVALAIASYPGTLTLSTSVPGAVLGGPTVVPFDVVDFAISANAILPMQNLPIGGTGQISAAVTTQSPTGTAFPVGIVPTAATSVSFKPASINGSGASVPFTAIVGASTPPSPGRIPDVITVTASNHGVQKTADIPVNYFTVDLVSTSLLVNDPASPLNIPVIVGTGPAPRSDFIDLQVNGNFDVTNGPANLTIDPVACGTFTTNFTPAAVLPNDRPTLQIYGNQGTNCPPATPLLITADIPQTNPALRMPVYKLFITATGAPLLRVVAATPFRDLTAQPWLSGEPLDWIVTVANTGSSASSNGVKVTFLLDNQQVGQATLTSIAPGQQEGVTIHTVAVDVPEDSPNQIGFIQIHVDNDPRGSANPDVFGDFRVTGVTLANWGIAVTSQFGATEGTPVQLRSTTPSATVTIGVKNAAAFNPNLSLTLINGVYNSGQLNVPGISPTTLTASGSSSVTVSLANATALNGVYFAQVIAQMKDNGVVTAQRQATIHIFLLGQPNTQASVALSSEKNNIGSDCINCGTPLQLNGPLPEQFNLTAVVDFCSSGTGCPGTIDVSFTDTFQTVTKPPVTTIAVSQTPTPFPVVVKAADDLNGAVTVGPAQVQVGLTANEAPFFAARTPNPDQAGPQYIMVFNVGDIFVNTGARCVGVPPQAASIGDYFVALDTQQTGFNLPSVSWEWQDSNHVQVSGAQLSFGTNSGTAVLSATGYALPAFPLTNNSRGIEGLQTYYFAVTVSNSFGTATKYFPVDFDLSTSQTSCPNLGASRGSVGGTLIRGSWGKAGLNAPNTGTPSSARGTSADGKLPDLRISASDVSFTPSIPKQGDTVAVRFRISNVGDGDATGVPIALQVRGSTVASDTFDIPAGKTVLGGLEWANARVAGAVQTAAERSPENASVRNVLRAARFGGELTVREPNATRADAQAQIVIDPQKTITQKSALAKSAPLAHFGIRNAAADTAAMAAVGEQRVLLELPEGGCGGLKFASGAGSCSSADITFTVEDLAKATYKLESLSGVADLGLANGSTANASYGSQALGQNGHTYAVQLNGGKVGTVTVTAVRNPEQLSEAAKRLFRQRHAAKIVKNLGGDTDAPETGDTAGTGSTPMVYFDIVYQGN